jgi:UDP-glucose 4-epimerase
MKILVTGGLGFVGSHLVDRFVEIGHEVHVVDNLSTGLLQNKNERATTFIMDVVDFCHKFNVRYDKIFHLANCARILRSFQFTEETLINNYTSTVALCEYIKKTSSGFMYFASSSTTEFTNQFNNPYTFSKHVCDTLLTFYGQSYNVRNSLVKFYNVYGSNYREKDLGEYTTVISKFKNQYVNNVPLTIIGDGSRRRDFTSIEDTVDALQILLYKEVPGETYHLGTGKNYSILEIAKAFDHPYLFVEDRKYELQNTLCEKQNVPDWSAKTDLIDHIQRWKRNYAHS